MKSQIEKWLFRLGVLCFSTDFALCGRALSVAQGGLNWEVPVAVIEEVHLLSMGALALAILGLVLGVVSRFFPGLSKAGRISYFAAAAFAVVLLAVLWKADPAQWPGRAPLLSKASGFLTVPSAMLGLLSFWAIGFRSVK